MSQGFEHIYMCGTSKGGTAAIYYGLKYGVDRIISSACQYNVGNYLSHYPEILQGMMGNTEHDISVDILNSKQREQLEKYKDSNTEIILVYSKQEHIYNDDIIDLIHDLNKYNYKVCEVEKQFLNHSEIGIHFLNYIQEYSREVIK